jgi:hypothetical protein
LDTLDQLNRLTLQIRSGRKFLPDDPSLAPVFCIWMFGGALLVSSVTSVIVLASAEKEYRSNDVWDFFQNTEDNLAEASSSLTLL